MLDDLEKCYEDSLIFIFRVGCSRATCVMAVVILKTSEFTKAGRYGSEKYV